MNILNNEAVSVTIGATVFTDIGALLVLAIVAGQNQGEASVWHGIQIILMMVGYAILILFGLPRVGKIFFKHNTNRSDEFQFVLVALFLSALLAEKIGMHAIVGLFSQVWRSTKLCLRAAGWSVRWFFLGESFFIPIFLIYVGMVIDPKAIFVSIQTITYGFILTLLVYGTKFIAAWIAGAIFHYSWDERFTIWGLSQAQTAASLATVLVVVQHFGSRNLPAPKNKEQKPLFHSCLLLHLPGN